MTSAFHLVWIPAGALTGFLASWLFGEPLRLPVDLYYLIYFVVILGFLMLYTRTTQLDLGIWIRRRLLWGLILGTAVGLVMVQAVLARPETVQLSGWLFWWALFWRGLMYGAVDGLLLFAFPWIVTWRAFRAEERGFGVRLSASMVSWLGVLLVTTVYHLGYTDFRSGKIVQPNIGSAITATATILSANPVASPLAHVFLHVTAVVHAPYTELFLPPHRDLTPKNP